MQTECASAVRVSVSRMSEDVTRNLRVVRLVKGGPALVEGPVRIVTEDGNETISDRFMVAVCRCRRSDTYPLCDTSHRRSRPTPK